MREERRHWTLRVWKLKEHYSNSSVNGTSASVLLLEVQLIRPYVFSLPLTQLASFRLTHVCLNRQTLNYSKIYYGVKLDNDNTMMMMMQTKDKNKQKIL